MLSASGHNGLFGEGSGRTEVGCMAHAFRKFEDALESEPKLAREAMHPDDQLYGIERKGKAARLDVSGGAICGGSVQTCARTASNMA